MLAGDIENMLRWSITEFEYLPESVIERFGERFILEVDGKEIEVNKENIDVVLQIVQEELEKRKKPLWLFASELSDEVLRKIDNLEDIIDEANKVITGKNKYPRF